MEYVMELRRGIERLRLSPALERLYTLEEIDLMAAIVRWEERKRFEAMRQ